MKQRRRKWMEVAFVTGLLLFAAGCSRGTASNTGSAGEMIAEVTPTKVMRVEIQRTVTVGGNVVALPNQDVRVSALVPGRITQLNVAVGDTVRASEVLAELDSHTYQGQFEQAQAMAQQARANLQNARQNLDRNQTLFGRGIVARKDLENARTQLAVTQAAEQQAQAVLEMAKIQLARTKILSPLNGIVAQRFASVGEQVDGTAAQPIAEVANIREVDLFGSVPSIYLGKVHVGESLRVTCDAFPGRTFAGRIVAISPAVDPNTNVGSVRIRIVNPGGSLKLGMYLSAEIPVETHPDALTLPLEAIYRDQKNEPRVYRIEGDEAAAVPVTLGIETSSRVEILSGVTEGETVVLSGGYGLPDHAKIKVEP